MEQGRRPKQSWYPDRPRVKKGTRRTGPTASEQSRDTRAGLAGGFRIFIAQDPQLWNSRGISSQDPQAGLKSKSS